MISWYNCCTVSHQVGIKQCRNLFATNIVLIGNGMLDGGKHGVITLIDLPLTWSIGEVEEMTVVQINRTHYDVGGMAFGEDGFALGDPACSIHSATRS